MERRAHERVPSKVDVHARVAGRPGRATVFDLSVNGCRIETSNGFVAPGDTIILIFGDIRMVGRVIWCDGRDAGVKFRTQMHAAVVAHLGFKDEPIAGQMVATPNCVTSPIPFHSRSCVLTGLTDVVAFFTHH